jgi:hypothetical protein
MARCSSVSGLVFAGLFFIGLAAGMLAGRPDAGSLLGLGLGFIGMAAAKYKCSE